MIGILGNTVIEGKRRLKKLRSGQGSEGQGRGELYRKKGAVKNTPCSQLTFTQRSFKSPKGVILMLVMIVKIWKQFE